MERGRFRWTVGFPWTWEGAITKGLRTNEQIRISPVRLIDENDDQVGIVETAEAIRKAREIGMDLVEVAPNDRPPVCRIMDYGKWKYRQNKKEQKAKHRHHAQQLKEVRLRPKTDVHDRDYKIKHARSFLEAGDRVQFTMLFRGREMAHQDLGLQRMREIAAGLVDVAKVEIMPRMAGRRMTMTVMPLKKGGVKPGELLPASGGAGPDADQATVSAAPGSPPPMVQPGAPPAPATG